MCLDFVTFESRIFLFFDLQSLIKESINYKKYKFIKLDNDTQHSLTVLIKNKHQHDTLHAHLYKE